MIWRLSLMISARGVVAYTERKEYWPVTLKRTWLSLQVLAIASAPQVVIPYERRAVGRHWPEVVKSKWNVIAPSQQLHRAMLLPC